MIAKRECERKDSRTYKIYVNLSIALSMQLFQVLLGFVVRKVFILTLGVAYLGYNSVFSNILQMLSLADLGIGVAVTSYLYKPLADNECDRVNALMALYKKIYNIIGIIVLIIGIIISFILEYIIPDISISTGYLRCLFFIHLGGTVSSYYLAYKRTLIIADQKSYVANLVDGISYLVISGVQILILLIKPNYMIFLVLNVAKNVISNVIISLFCNRKYGKIEKNVDNKLISEYKPQVVQYIKDVFISRIGAVVYYGTDSIIISIYRGSLLAGYLSNYTLITGYLNIIISQLLSSVQATFGNYINSGNSVYQQRKMTDHYFLANYFMGNFCMICFIFLVQPFVSLYFGQKLLLPFSTAVWLGVNFLLTTLIQLPSQVFTIYKLFRYDRPIIIVSTLLNVFISVLLVKKLGVDGVLIGTFITSLIYLFSRFYAIAKYVFKVNYLYYLKKVFQYFAVSAASFFITYTVFRNGQKVVGFSFIIRAICVSLLAILTPATALSKTEEFKFLTDKLIPKKISGYIRSRTLAAATILVIAASLIIGGGDKAMR